MRDLSRYHNPARFAETAQRHRRAISWEQQGRIPLGIHVVNPEYLQGMTYSDWLKPEVYCELQTNHLADTLEVGSDLAPVVGFNHLGEAPLTTLFGAEQFTPEKVSGTSNPWDIGPSPLPIFDSIDEVQDLASPSLDGGLMPDLERMARYYREHLPEWVALVGPMPTGPFSAASALRGFDFLYDLLDRPELCLRLLLICAETIVRLEQRFRAVVGTDPGVCFTNFAVLGAGLRLGEDSICSVSADMIRTICTPVYQRVNELFGGSGHVHFCTLPHSRLEHIYPALASMPDVAVVSSQFGFEYYANHLEELRGKLAVESFYGDAYGYVRGTHGSFGAWAREFVSRFKNESGLVLYLQVHTVDEGNRVWDDWEQAHALS